MLNYLQVQGNNVDDYLYPNLDWLQTVGYTREDIISCIFNFKTIVNNV